MSKKAICLQDNIINILDNKKLWFFIKWYLNGQKKEEWENVRKAMNIKQPMEWAIKTYLEREDVQKAMIQIVKLNKDFNLIQIYNKMYEKALKGDVNSANWIVKFSESDFFGSKKNELDDIINGLNLDDE
ncbi:hypothetical protein CLL_A2385 [Clostridium botulinum B str. Eklund 17B (NRP)]|uniref:Uncharacterized protein n=1 Tax=Clostridium botulinum (strain Eklund 17B / Type B) TaxID=935198 RepID=B2TRM2_CLOBB|nr:MULTISPECIES: hypothetical protein [unclassified Clostridium]ACD23629.1 hypothetical protein CLL_A2385 [Clostridium botulinum B str. Eklund 17B (NRP)]MBN1052637.1 hypothetical protein [Clostridium botulinum]MBY6975905.1 hypothetical protein [Clostridium botulinum]MBY7000328.1 hypothetical protein [Clostridium botulinum]MCR1273088.1 hypothetical protein [Clostridium botulinum]